MMMDMSELNLTQSRITNVSTMSVRPAPRMFDFSTTNNIIPPSSTIKADTKGYISDLATTIHPDQLQQKIRLDHSMTAQQRDEESRIRGELDRSKLLLIEQYQINETKLKTELADCKANIEQQMKEKEAIWIERDAQRVADIQRLEQKLHKVLEMTRKRITDKEKTTIEQLEKQEEIWKLRIEDIKEDHEEIIQSIHNKYKLEKDSYIIAEKARIIAKEDQIKKVFNNKLTTYEKQLHDVMRNYHDKELIIHGSLEEARKEIILIKQNSIKYEEKLKKELLYKDKIILNLQSKLGLIDNITKIADSWRNASKDLAKMIVTACMSIQDMPILPTLTSSSTSTSSMNKNTNILYNYIQKEETEESIREKQVYNAEVKAYYRLRKDRVTIQKDLISRTLRNSKVSSIMYYIIATATTTISTTTTTISTTTITLTIATTIYS